MTITLGVVFGTAGVGCMALMVFPMMMALLLLLLTVVTPPIVNTATIVWSQIVAYFALFVEDFS